LDSACTLSRVCAFARFFCARLALPWLFFLPGRPAAPYSSPFFAFLAFFSSFATSATAS
jgi:hypothetical protein